MRLLREPLLQFFVVGGLFFLLFAVGDSSDNPSSNLISVTPERIDKLAAQFSAAWNRTPTEDELENIIDGYIREEVYYRDALALGLDQNDTVIRQRLRQKMEFLTDTGASLMEPTPDELQAYFTANENDYQRRPQLAIEQVFLGQVPSEQDTDRALALLRASPNMSVGDIGERSLLPAQLRLTRAEGINSVFGEGFFSQIADFPLDMWSGPVVSSYGTHLVRVTDSRSAVLPPLDEIREAVIRDWKAEKAIQLRELDFAARLEKYVVVRTRGDGE